MVGHVVGQEQPEIDYEEAEQARAAQDDAPYEHGNEELAGVPRHLNFGTTHRSGSFFLGRWVGHTESSTLGLALALRAVTALWGGVLSCR